ncbi:hypothetical protein JF544_11595 [Halobacillus kuroshimensis]|uniref:Uncharacterized protein n=1 Tax=Halobacillus kuroshimensis TaxID=302481 RepID=A0ABS3DXD2_9BACI|nr:hypothetical protein [Halobacillus kuroshimensis]MBN8235898.1 hypothetical protein [Halobacillus kuroshimensis]
MVVPAGTARAEDPLGQAIFLTMSAEGMPSAFIYQKADCDPLHDKWTTLIGSHRLFLQPKAPLFRELF